MTRFEQCFRIDDPLPSPAAPSAPTLPTIRVGAVQCAWNPDARAHAATLAEGVAIAAGQGAAVVCLQELTLAPYFAVAPDAHDEAARWREDLETGPTVTLLRELATRHGIAMHGSLYEAAADGVGYNTAVCVDAGGALVARTRKLHIPRFPFYHEDKYFAPGNTGYPVCSVAGARFGFPTCWDQWFPELARSYSLAGAEIVVYPTAIGSEPHLDDFDSQPLWRQMIAANGLANATFMVAVNRIGTEGPLTFYGSSFISDPYGRIIVDAPRDRPAVLVADLDLNHRRDWLTFGLLATRRPDQYQALVDSGSQA
jgi:N-carbamoylputrescine amidase